MSLSWARGWSFNALVGRADQQGQLSVCVHCLMRVARKMKHPAKAFRQEFGLTRTQILVAVALLVTGLVAMATGFYLATGGVETGGDGDRATLGRETRTEPSAVRRPNPVLPMLALIHLLIARELKQREPWLGEQPASPERAREPPRVSAPDRETAHRGARHRSPRR